MPFSLFDLPLSLLYQIENAEKLETVTIFVTILNTLLHCDRSYRCYQWEMDWVCTQCAYQEHCSQFSCLSQEWALTREMEVWIWAEAWGHFLGTRKAWGNLLLIFPTNVLSPISHLSYLQQQTSQFQKPQLVQSTRWYFNPINRLMNQLRHTIIP